MPIDLMPWLILWAILTTVVLGLALKRYMLYRKEEDLGGLHVVTEDPKIPEEEVKLTKKMARIDLWGQTLTVISAVLIFAIGVGWLYNRWLIESNLP
ncbi:MAG: hypothetical protein HY236_06155 [Acidobacteria bacterium]|nr:hypothetical protein [Acidobacteriota bacterium]